MTTLEDFEDDDLPRSREREAELIAWFDSLGHARISQPTTTVGHFSVTYASDTTR